ncbi:hypothetical protein KP509_31G015600 [Ceratopteris richardii]|uniref:Acyl-coenzyme A oxidase N-terminal domain-containing protein n=1 Tax=Ceratopteris richardii TaxID=49495 RepID=A0A8T2QXV7_CERRI|nr:hypothetical protein KP509_31G015600 [Ceratopteris richardii]
MEMEALIMEHQNVEFDVCSLKVVFSGGEQNFEMVSRMAAIAATDPVFERVYQVATSRTDLFKSGLRKAARVRQHVLDLSLTGRLTF